MSFAAQIEQWATKAQMREQDIFTRWVEACHRSIVEGSAVTGAPGQPVETGALRRSWRIHYETPFVAEIRTRFWHYAPQIEDGIRVVAAPHTLQRNVAGVKGPSGRRTRGGKIKGSAPTVLKPMTLRSLTGGWHSVKLTIAGAERLLSQVVQEMPPT